MTRLAGYLRDHGGPVEGDLQRVYGIDLGDFWRRKITLRRLGVLVHQLPPGSALWRATGDDDAWTGEQHMAAHAIDRVSEAIAVMVRAKNYDLFPRPAQQRELAEAAANKPTGAAYAEQQAAKYAARQAHPQDREED